MTNVLKLSEKNIQDQIRDYLDRRGIYNRRCNVGASRMNGGIWVRFGKKGDPDLFAIFRGMHIAIEVKRPGGEQSDEQKSAMGQIRNAGAIYILAESLDDVLEYFEPPGQLAQRKGGRSNG